jgi:hypothetical protein
MKFSNFYFLLSSIVLCSYLQAMEDNLELYKSALAYQFRGKYGAKHIKHINKAIRSVWCDKNESAYVTYEATQMGSTFLVSLEKKDKNCMCSISFNTIAINSVILKSEEETKKYFINFIERLPKN